MGYSAEGPVFHLFANQNPGTAALYRWTGHDEHFYTTDPTGEAALSLGYSAEGITGYLWPAQHTIEYRGTETLGL